MKYLHLIGVPLCLFLLMMTQTQSGSTQSVSRDYLFPRWSPDGNYLLYTALIDSTTVEIWLASSDGESQQKIYELTEGGGFINYTWTEESNALVFSFRNSDNSSELMMYSLKAEEVTSLYHIPEGTILGLEISPDGDGVAFVVATEEEYSVAIVDLSESTYHNLVPPSDVGHWAVAWLPDDRIVFSNSNELSVVSLSENNTVDLYSGRAVLGIDADADGNLILNVDDIRGDFNAFLLSALDGEVVDLTQGKFGRVLYPQWLDEDTIVFASNKDGSSDIWRMSLNNLSATNLTENPGFEDVFPHVNLVTQQIAFASFEIDPDGGVGADVQIDIWVMDSDGENLTNFTD